MQRSWHGSATRISQSLKSMTSLEDSGQYLMRSLADEVSVGMVTVNLTGGFNKSVLPNTNGLVPSSFQPGYEARALVGCTQICHDSIVIRTASGTCIKSRFKGRSV